MSRNTSRTIRGETRSSWNSPANTRTTCSRSVSGVLNRRVTACAGSHRSIFTQDIGHSTNARQQLKEFLVGTLDATEEELAALRAPAHTGNGDSFLLVAVAGALLAAVGGYFVFMA